jgi:hypothetical protein
VPARGGCDASSGISGDIEVSPDERIVATLSRQLTWSHLALLLPLEAPLARAFYAEMCRTERWSVRALRKQIM